MNILHLTPDFKYSDGRSYYVYLLLKYLKRKKHNVYLFTNGGDSFDRLNELSVPYETEKTLSDKYSFLRSVNSICSFAEKNKIDIIHSHHRYYELMANAVRKKMKLKTVFTALSIVDRRYFVEYRSDRIIAVSPSVREMLISRFNVRKSKISLIPNFTDTEETGFVKKKNVKKNQNVLNILSAGRLHKEKDHSTLVNAISLLKGKALDIKLTLIGEGEEKLNIENQIRKFSVYADILPPVKDLYNYINETDICVLSSVRDPLPGFMLESGLFGKPFIGTVVDGISDTITHGVNGLLFRKRKAEELADRIFTFAEDRSFAKKCGENLRRTVLSDFTEKQVIPEIESLYNNL